MRRHCVCLSIFVVLAAALAAPSLALAATTYQIKDAQGHVRGSLSHPQGVRVIWTVKNQSGVRVGTLLVGGAADGNASSAFHTPKAEGDFAQTAWAVDKVLYASQPYPLPDVVIGKAVLAQGRWRLMRRSGTSYVKAGSAPLNADCPPETALCAARLLLWPHDASLGTWQVRTADKGAVVETIWGAQSVRYGSDSAANSGMGATVWYQDAGAPSLFCGQVGHEMTGSRPVASEWVIWDASWNNQGLVKRISSNLFTVVNAGDPNMTATNRVVRSDTGPWHLQVFWSPGHWRTIYTAPRGCPGAWAAGAAILENVD